MKRILLFSGSILLFFGCGEKSNANSSEIPSDEEMKSRVEMEEIEFKLEVDSIEIPTENRVDLSLQERESYSIERARSDDPFPPNIILPYNVDSGPSSPPDDGLVIDEIWEPPHEPLPDFPVLRRRVSGVNPDDSIYDFPQVAARYPEGAKELKKFIRESIRYPKGGACVQGTVYVSLVIDKDGNVRDVEVMRGGISEELNAEALRVVRSMPKWIPAQNNGKVVAARLRLPIYFVLN